LKITQSRARRHSLDFKDTHSPCYLFDWARVVGRKKKKLGSGRCVTNYVACQFTFGKGGGGPLLRHGGPSPQTRRTHYPFSPNSPPFSSVPSIFSLSHQGSSPAYPTQNPTLTVHTDPCLPRTVELQNTVSSIEGRNYLISKVGPRSGPRLAVRLSHLFPGACIFGHTRQRF